MNATFNIIYSLLSRSLVAVLVALLSVNYLPDTLFKDFPFESRNMQPIDFDSVQPNWNSHLTDGKTEFIQLNNIIGPESVAFSNNGLLYTGLADGRLVELDPSKGYKLRNVLRFKQSSECRDNDATKPEQCGRILQVRFDNQSLLALECQAGLFKIDTKLGSKSLLGPKKSLSKLAFYNAFAIDPVQPNLVYITVSSTKWNLKMIVWGLLELDNSGQLIAVDTKTGKSVVLLDELMMANGVDVDPTRDQLILAESGRAKVSRLSLKNVRDAFKVTADGQKATGLRQESLIPVVPGFPDNIVVHGDTAYIALPFVRPKGRELVDHLASMANVRKAYARLAYGLGLLLERIHQFYPNPLLQLAYHDLKSGHINYRLLQNDKSAVIEYNLATGSSRLLGTDSLAFVSEAVPGPDPTTLFLGSFRSPFLVKVKVKPSQ